MRSRALGIQMIIAPVCWLVTIVLVIVAAVSFGGAVLVGASSVLTPGPDDARIGTVLTTLMLGTALGCVLVLSPCARLGELVGGIVELSRGRS